MSARDRIPPVLRRCFPRTLLLPCPMWPNTMVCPGIWHHRIPPYEYLSGLVFRFTGIKAADVEQIKIAVDYSTLWCADVEMARMLELYQGRGRTPRRYAFLNFTEPGLGVGGFNVKAHREVEVVLTLKKPCRVDWWAVV